jgi:uncharacterized MAPEG superfamily protein
MVWVDLVTVAALLQYMFFATLVGRARGQYGVKAPATTGNDMFERYYRVQMNTLELMVVFIPCLWMAAHYWSAGWMSAIGAIYLIGRFIYLKAYVRDPASRSLGYTLSFIPVVALMLAALVGLVQVALGR